MSSKYFLAHYTTMRTLQLACAASSEGGGAVTNYVMDDGQEQPIHLLHIFLTKANETKFTFQKGVVAITVSAV